MPQVTVYVRNEDMARWKALENKSQAIHDMLRADESSLATMGTPPPLYAPQGNRNYGLKDVRAAAEKISVADATEWEEVQPKKTVEKLPCCEAKAPCRHWTWDLITGQGYVNTLTGELREPDYA